jgi:hypothetical protein
LNPTDSDGFPGGDARGGGLYVAGGTLTLLYHTLSGNSLQGGSGGRGDSPLPSWISILAGGRGGDGGGGYGGGLYVAAGTVTLTGEAISGKRAQGGNGGDDTANFNTQSRWRVAPGPCSDFFAKTLSRNALAVDV